MKFEINLIDDNGKISIQIIDRETRYSTTIEEISEYESDGFNAFDLARILIKRVKPVFMQIAKQAEKERNSQIARPLQNIINNFSSKVGE